MKLPKYPFEHPGLVAADGNKAVLRTKLGHLCGYVALPAAEIPKEWHGDYNADGLQYLEVHGGLTYCEVGGGDEEARKIAAKAAYDAAGQADETGSLDERMSFYTARRKAGDAARLTVPYDYVVFGFDCAHAGDDSKPELQQVEYVMALTRQMEQQLREHAAMIEEWRAAPRDRRIAMMDELRAKAAHKTEIGFGAMISMLGGAAEFGEWKAS